MKYLLSVAASASAALLGLCVSPAQAQMHVNAHARHKGNYNFFRPEPNRQCPILEKMPQGTPFVITGKSGKYYSIVRTDGRTGWTACVNAVIERQSPFADTATDEDGEEGHVAAPVAVAHGEPVAPLASVVAGKVREGSATIVRPVAEPTTLPVAAPSSPPVAHVVSRAAHNSKHVAPKVKPHVVKAHPPRVVEPSSEAPF